LWLWLFAVPFWLLPALAVLNCLPSLLQPVGSPFSLFSPFLGEFGERNKTARVMPFSKRVPLEQHLVVSKLKILRNLHNFSTIGGKTLELL
jgi:hypothetical protein